MTPDRLDRKGDESSALVSEGNLTGDMFQEPQQGLGGFTQEIKHKSTKSGSKRASVIYLRQSWRPQRCSSGPQRRTGRASTSECPRLQPSSSSTCTLSLPWGNHLNSKYKVKQKWGKEQKKLPSAKNSTIMQRLICIPFGKHLSRLTTPKSSALSRRNSTSN